METANQRTKRLRKIIGSKSHLTYTLIHLIQSTKKRRPNISNNLTTAMLRTLLETQDNKCAVTGINFLPIGSGNNVGVWNSRSLDRIDSNKGYVEGNVQFILNCLNMFKGQLTDEELLPIALSVVEGLTRNRKSARLAA